MKSTAARSTSSRSNITPAAAGASTTTAKELWRTLAVWIDVLPELDHDEEPEFTLLTTSSAPDGSTASLLRRDGQRDPELALSRLRGVATLSSATTTAAARQRFAELDAVDQERLVSATVVRDQQAEITDLDDRLKQLFRLGVRPEHEDAFIDSLKGWWYARCVALLRGTEPAVAASDLLYRVHDLRDSYHPDNLPFDYDIVQPTHDERRAYETWLFVRQLQIVAATNELLQIAINDYHRAYTNRSRWLRLGLLRPGELDHYERRLVDEWKRQHAYMRANLDDSATEEQMQKAGLQLWRDLDATTVPIRPRFTEQALTRGTYHELANRPEVGWHPVFEERLRELLEGAA